MLDQLRKTNDSIKLIDSEIAKKMAILGKHKRLNKLKQIKEETKLDNA